MGTDDDIALSLPEPPPPRPARRDAAIDEALRRFDAVGEPPRVARPRPSSGPPPWWRTISRPQVGVLVSAALVAVIGVPAAWISLADRFTTRPETSARPGDGAATPSPAAPAPSAGASTQVLADVPPPPAEASRLEQATVTAPPGTRADGGKAACAADDCAPEVSARAEANATAPPAPAMKLAQDRAAPPPPTVAPMMRAEQASRSGADREERFAGARAGAPPAMTGAPAPPAPPPPPPPAIAVAAEETAGHEIVVTGSRSAPARRGDWNACTVNDPGRSLNGCKKLVDPGAKGPAGRAASRLADGLALAWQGDVDGAIAAFDHAIELRPRLSFAYLNRGLAYQRKGELDRAIADLDRAVRYAPGAARGYYNRSLLLRQRGDAGRARADEDRAVDIDPRYDAVVK